MAPAWRRPLSPRQSSRVPPAEIADDAALDGEAGVLAGLERVGGAVDVHLGVAVLVLAEVAGAGDVRYVLEARAERIPGGLDGGPRLHVGTVVDGEHAAEGLRSHAQGREGAADVGVDLRIGLVREIVDQRVGIAFERHDVVDELLDFGVRHRVDAADLVFQAVEVIADTLDIAIEVVGVADLVARADPRHDPEAKPACSQGGVGRVAVAGDDELVRGRPAEGELGGRRLCGGARVNRSQCSGGNKAADERGTLDHSRSPWVVESGPGRTAVGSIDGADRSAL